PFELVDRERTLEPPRAISAAEVPAPPASRDRALGAINLVAAVAALVFGALLVRAPGGATRSEMEPASAPTVELVDRTGARFVPRDYRRIASASVSADQILAELVEPGRVIAVSSYGKARAPVSYRF